MIFKTAIYAATVAAVGTLSYVGLAKAFPDQAALIGDIVRDHVTGWDDWACKSDPAGCLENRYLTLGGLQRDVDRRLSAVRAQKGSVDAMVDEQQSLVSRNAALIAEGKAIYEQHSRNPGRDIEFVGKVYPSVELFEQQLALLFREKKTREANLANARELAKKLHESEEQLMIHAGDITLAKQMIPAQIELVKANKTLGDFGQNLTMINDVIKGSEVGLADTEQLIRTTAELVDPSSSPSGATAAEDPDFKKFLAQ